MGLFGLWNYEDYLLNLVVKSRAARNGLVTLLIYLITAAVRFHISILLCVLFTWNNYFLDLITPIILAIPVSMASDTLFRYAEIHRPQYERWVDYLIENYSMENFIRWKRIFLTILLGYILLGLAFIQIDNYYIRLSLAQTTISFIICDFLEQKLPQAWYNYLLNWWHRPQITKFPKRAPVIDNYIPQKSNRLERRHSLGSIGSKPIVIKKSVTHEEFPNLELPDLEPIVQMVDAPPPKPPTPPMEIKESNLVHRIPHESTYI